MPIAAQTDAICIKHERQWHGEQCETNSRSHCQRLQGGNPGTPASAIKCPFAPRAITLGGSRPAQSGHGRTCSLSRSGEVAREYQRSYTRFGTKSGTDDCDGSARANDERGRIWGSVGSFRSASSLVVSRNIRKSATRRVSVDYRREARTDCRPEYANCSSAGTSSARQRSARVCLHKIF